jgi:hypothetical protein
MVLEFALAVDVLRVLCPELLKHAIWQALVDQGIGEFAYVARL